MAEISIKKIEKRAEKARIIKEVLDDLPEFFALEDANEMYIKEGAEQPLFASYSRDELLGMITLKKHFDSAYEIYVMGVKKAQHKRGVGRKLVVAAEAYVKAQNGQFLQVKTLDSAHADEGYRKTRAFYEACGFVPLEVFKNLWSEDNPCLMYIKAVQ